MIKLVVTNEKNLELYELEKVHVGENKFGYYLIFLPEMLNGYNLSNCEVKLIQIFEDNTSVSINVDTTQETRPIKKFITLDATAQAQTVTLSVLITHNGDVIGKTNQKTYQVYPTKNFTPIDPREELDEIIAEQRAEIAEQAETISTQGEIITQQTEQITELNGEVSTLEGTVAEQQATITRQNTTIDELNERRTPVYIPAQLESKLITPKDTTKYYSPSEGKDGFSSVTVDGATVEALGLNENYYKHGEPFLDKVGTYCPFPENSYGGIYFTELNENDFPVGIKVVNYDYNYNNFSIPGLDMNALRNNIKSFILLDCKNVKIGNGLFTVASLLTTCQLDGVISISGGAFQGCTSLTEINLPDSLTSIGGNAFQGCTSLTEINLPDSLTSIGDKAFYGCTSLTELTLPDSLTSIGANAFYNCTSLTELTLPDSLTRMGDYAFQNCTSLTELTLPDSLTRIGGGAFQGCTSLTELTLPDSLTRIGDYAFQSCTSLTELTLPDSLTSISGSAFQGCTSLTEINLPDSLTSIGDKAFYGCTSLTGLTLPDSLTSIGGNAFYGCTSLTGLTLPDSLTRIGDYAFQSCTSLTELTLPDSLTSISGSAFQGCTSLTSLTLAQGFNCDRLDVQWSTRFTAETIVACLEALADRTGQTAYTITFGTTNLNKLTAEQKAIAINKNWNLA